MFDYSERIKVFRADRVRLDSDFRDKLLAHRKANRNRLISRLPDYISGITVNEGSFRSQGSVAVRMSVHTPFPDIEYDIDDGLLLWKHELVDENGAELSAEDVRKNVCAALQDDRFVKPPEIHHNCVRVFYRESDEEKHHVDFAIYRVYYVGEEKIRELAGSEGWVRSDPTQVNHWVNNLVEERNQQTAGWGTQFRHLVQLLKRFCRSRRYWDLPNGMKLTMLVAEYQPPYDARIDLVFRQLLQKLKDRLLWNKVIQNLAHPDKPALTRTAVDQNVVDLETRLGEALDQLATLDDSANECVESARAVWDWMFKSDGFFAQFDADRKAEEKHRALLEKAALVGTGARTSSTGVLGSLGIANVPHRFYGEETMD